MDDDKGTLVPLVVGVLPFFSGVPFYSWPVFIEKDDSFIPRRSCVHPETLAAGSDGVKGEIGCILVFGVRSRVD